MKGLQDIMMYGCLITLCSLCLLLSDRTVQAKNIPDDSIHSDSLDIKDFGNIEKPSSSSAEKRKWADYSSWGKRRWDGNASWGKRWSEGLTSWGKRNADKRQWNQFLTWGKRNADADKRKDWSSFATWGKRGKWSNFSSWGKRDLSTDALENAITDAVISRFDDDGDHGLNRDEMLAFVGWLRATGAAAEPVLYSNH